MIQSAVARGPSIAFAPDRWWSRVLFTCIGWRLFVTSMRRLAEAPSDLPLEACAQLQRDVGARLLRHLRVQLEFHGLSNLPRHPHVVVALHEGLADVLALSQLPLTMRMVAREEILEWPWIGPALRRMGHLGIEPEHGAASYRRLIVAAEQTLRGGAHVVLFPQGAVLGIETAFQPGAFRLARLMRAPILPIVITGAHRIWEHPFSPCVRYGQRVGIAVLPPVSAADVTRCTPESLQSRLQRQMKAVALSGSLPEPRHYVPERDGFWDGFAFDIDEAFPEILAAVEQHRAIHGVTNCAGIAEQPSAAQALQPVE
jgi:1-acyl-sn-glycerol-3-phosphate acyltransferase